VFGFSVQALPGQEHFPRASLEDSVHLPTVESDQSWGQVVCDSLLSCDGEKVRSWRLDL